MDTVALNVLIIGCGNIAGGFDAHRDPALPPLTHAGAFSRHPSFRLAACIEPDEARRAAFMARWSVPEGAATTDEFAARGARFDVISICSPTVLHAAHLEAALALQPRLVFCEKPVTPDAALTRDLVERCGQTGVLLAVNHNRRWAPDVVRLRDELQRGDWGAVRSLAGTYGKGLLNNGSHLVDLVRLLAGPLVPLTAALPVNDHWPDDPSVAALLDASGVPFHMVPSHAGDYSLFELQLVTAKGVLLMENGGMSWRIRKSVSSPNFAGYQTLGPAREEAGSYALSMGLAAENIHAALTVGAPLASTGETALETQELCDALLRIALAGKVP